MLYYLDPIPTDLSITSAEIELTAVTPDVNRPRALSAIEPKVTQPLAVIEAQVLSDSSIDRIVDGLRFDF